MNEGKPGAGAPSALYTARLAKMKGLKELHLELNFEFYDDDRIVEKAWQDAGKAVDYLLLNE